MNNSVPAFCCGGALALIFFAGRCGGSDHPLIRMDAFKNIPFDCHLIGFFLINAIMPVAAFLLPNFFQIALAVTSMTAGLMRLPTELKSYGNTSFNTLMQFAGAVGTSVCAACVAFSQNSAAADSYEAKTTTGTVHGFVFLFVLTAMCVALQMTGFKYYEKNSNH